MNGKIVRVITLLGLFAAATLISCRWLRWPTVDAKIRHDFLQVRRLTTARQRSIKPLGLSETNNQYASKIEETADGGGSRFGSEARETVKVVPARCVQTDGEVDEHETTQGIRRDEAQEFAKEKIEEEIIGRSHSPNAIWRVFCIRPDELLTRSESALCR